jgi:hypothetical protein|tara:strand:+ start:233 stop:568 length:336 start_codon:yes stop_codon:yes gene_type:complete
MVQRIKGAKVYKTMQGKTVDMDMLRKRNEMTPAVGNARVNARGDELGAGGQIVRKKEDVVKEYYENSKGVADEPAVRQSTSDQTELDDNGKDITDDDWIEDEDGNFVQKDS